MSHLPTVQILLSTYNGQKYINEQIKSLLNQKNINIKILIRDDGSTDETLKILETYKNNNIIDYYTGSNLGPAYSFIDLINHASKADYYAFCDQDDVWDADKLDTAINKIGPYLSVKPALYFSNTRIVDKNLNLIQNSNFHPRNTLGESLITNYVTGCTEVFNYKLLSFLKIYRPEYIYMHDSWSYRVCKALDGYVYFDSIPHFSYRQHSNNVIGDNNSSIKKIISSLKKSLDKESKTKFVKNNKVKIATELIKGYSQFIKDKELKKLEEVVNYRNNLKSLFTLLLDKDFRTYKPSSNIKFYLLVLLKYY